MLSFETMYLSSVKVQWAAMFTSVKMYFQVWNALIKYYT